MAAVRIIGAAGFRHSGRRPKLIGKNAKKDVHGAAGAEPVLRIYTDQGIDGVGFGNVTPEQAGGLIGHSLAEFWIPGEGVQSPLGVADHALFDLIGKVAGEPAWKLIGGAGPEWVPTYDSTLYFSDLLPEYQHRGVARLVDELEWGMAAGHRAFKIKVGRGTLWMDPAAGFQRDLEVVRALRAAAGPDIRLMADANDQFGVETAKRFVEAVGHELFFVEEMFPESVSDCLDFKEFMARCGLATLLADGESEHEVEAHRRLACRGALDVVQPDIRALGLTRQWRLSRLLSDIPGVRLASHNWGSYLGTFMMLQLGRGIGNFLVAEMDPMESDLFDDSHWVLKEGRVQVPDEPGSGLRLREDVFRERYHPAAWTVGTVRSLACSFPAI